MPPRPRLRTGAVRAPPFRRPVDPAVLRFFPAENEIQVNILCTNTEKLATDSTFTASHLSLTESEF